MCKFVKHHNVGPKRLVDFIYIGNEQSEEELVRFLSDYVYHIDHLGHKSGGFHFSFNDENALRFREQLRIDCVPVVVVLNRNLEIITRTGAEDLMHLHPDVVRTLWIAELEKLIEISE